MSDTPDDEWITFSEATKHAKENLEGWSSDLIREWLIAEIESGRVRARGGWFVPTQAQPPSNVFERQRWRDEGRPFQKKIVGHRKFAYPERALVDLRSFVRALEQVVHREQVVRDRIALEFRLGRARRRVRAYREQEAPCESLADRLRRASQQVLSGDPTESQKVTSYRDDCPPSITAAHRAGRFDTWTGVSHVEPLARAPTTDRCDKAKRSDAKIRERATDLATAFLKSGCYKSLKPIVDKVLTEISQEFGVKRGERWAYKVIAEARCGLKE